MNDRGLDKLDTRTYERDGKLIQQFADPNAYFELVKSRVAGDNSRRASTDDSWSAVSFTGATWAQTVEMMDFGWPEGVEKVEEFSFSLKTTLAGLMPVPERHYDVTGDFLDIGRLMTGDPECLITIVDSNYRVEANPAKIIRIVANLCISGSQPTKVLEMRGAAIVALAHILEMHGKRVQIDVVGANAGYNSDWGNRERSALETWIRVKRPDEPLHLPNLTFMLANAASFRRCMFSAWEHLGNEARRQFRFYDGQGYGRVSETQDQGDIYLAGFESGWATSEAATKKWIEAELGKQGIEVQESD